MIVRYFLSHPSPPRWTMMPLCSETAARRAERTPLHESSSFSKKTRGQERAPPQTRPAAPKRGVAVSVGARRWENHARNWAPKGSPGPRCKPQAPQSPRSARGADWGDRAREAMELSPRPHSRSAYARSAPSVEGVIRHARRTPFRASAPIWRAFCTKKVGLEGPIQALQFPPLS